MDELINIEARTRPSLVTAPASSILPA